MEIKNYSELSDFILSEHEKASDSLGVQNASKTFVKFNERQLIRYQRLYSKPLYKKAKRELKLQEAIDTMPHGFFWKIWNYSLWQKIKYLEKEQICEPKEAPKENPQVLYPVVQSRGLEPIDKNLEEV